MAEYVLKMIPHGTHDWNKFISPLDTQRLLEHCNYIFVLQIVERFYLRKYYLICRQLYDCTL